MQAGNFSCFTQITQLRSMGCMDAANATQLQRFHSTAVLTGNQPGWKRLRNTSCFSVGRVRVMRLRFALVLRWRPWPLSSHCSACAVAQTTRSAASAARNGVIIDADGVLRTRSTIPIRAGSSSSSGSPQARATLNPDVAKSQQAAQGLAQSARSGHQGAAGEERSRRPRRCSSWPA